MPPLETMDLKQRAILWAKSSVDKYGKVIVSSTPVEIPVRWLDKQAERMDAQGNTIAVDATAIVAQDITIDSILWLGKIDDVPDQTTLIPTTGLMQVKTFNSSPDLKNRSANTRRDIGMLRFTDTLPTS